MVNLRTALRWLEEHDLSQNAECWILSDNTVEPIDGIAAVAHNIRLGSRDIWSHPTPKPLPYRSVFDYIIKSYSGGGTLLWKDGYDYKGSYTRNPDNAVFFIFLPNKSEIVETHAEKMETKRKQAIELERVINASR